MGLYNIGAVAILESRFIDEQMVHHNQEDKMFLIRVITIISRQLAMNQGLNCYLNICTREDTV